MGNIANQKKNHHLKEKHAKFSGNEATALKNLHNNKVSLIPPKSYTQVL